MNSISFFRFALKITLCLALFGFFSTAKANDKTAVALNIAVAANFLHTFRDIQSVYEAQTGIKLKINSGSTGQLYHQIRFGAPYDIFLSADKKTSLRLIKEELALASSYFVYGRGRIVLWSRDKTLMLDNGDVFKTYDKNKRIAIANAKLAPYGKASQETLATIMADDQWQKNMITGQNITQVYQFIASGNVDMGFVSLAQLRFAQSIGKVKSNYWLVPNTLHQAIEQTAVLLNTSEQKSQAMNFLKFLRSPEALAIMQQYGYE